MMKVSIDSLKDSNEFLNTLLENMTSAIFIADKDIRIQSFNNSFHSLFYKNDDLIIGELFGNAIGCIYTVREKANCGSTSNCKACNLRSSIISTFLEKAPTERAILSRDFVINDQIIHKHFQFSRRNITFNHEEMILVIVDDITELQEQKIALDEKNQKLEVINKQKNELIGIAAHDLRNPLSVINSFSEIMFETAEDLKPQNLKEMLQIIQKTSHFSLQLLNDLLDFSKIDSGTLELKKIKLDYISFLKENIQQNEFFAVQKNMRITLNTSDPSIKFMFDPRRMEQVINNLISNAIKYSFPGNNIIVNVSIENESIVTSIEDSGQGIPEKDLPFIFQPFRQVSVKPTDNEKSTGLGLAIVKKIIDFHNGNITVSSTPGKGTKFTFYLPLC
jgi:signal transduction histidine kinase